MRFRTSFCSRASNFCRRIRITADGSLLLVFDSSNWNTGIQITVSAKSDDVIEDTSISVIRATNKIFLVFKEPYMLMEKAILD
jgi:molybdenum cofactor biosynthesis enzyme MoaA